MSERKKGQPLKEALAAPLRPQEDMGEAGQAEKKSASKPDDYEESASSVLLGKRLGNGEGAQKLAVVFFLADYDDDLALFLADVGAIIAGANQITENEGKAKSETDRVILSKAIRLHSVMADTRIDQYIARQLAARESPEGDEVAPDEPGTSAFGHRRRHPGSRRARPRSADDR